MIKEKVLEEYRLAILEYNGVFNGFQELLRKRFHAQKELKEIKKVEEKAYKNWGKVADKLERARTQYEKAIAKEVIK